MSELKPCPFCKGNGKLSTGASCGIPKHMYAYVRCGKCGARTPIFDDTQDNGRALFDAIKAWNRREGEEKE